MKRLARPRFEALVEEELAAIPEAFRDALANVSIELADEPGLEADEMERDLLGLYVGATREEMLSSDAHGLLPAKVYLYQRNLERDSADLAELKREIRLTLRHELAHHFGFEDEELERVWPEGA